MHVGMSHLELYAERTFTERLVGRREQAFLYARRRLHNALALGLGDAFALGLALVLAAALRYLWVGEFILPAWSGALLPLWWGGAAAMRLLPSWGLGPVEELRRLSWLLIGFFGLTAVALFLSQYAIHTSRLLLTLTFAFSLPLVPLVRLRVKRALVRRGQWGIPAVVYSNGDTGARVVELLRREGGLGYNPIALFDDDTTVWGDRVDGVQVLGGTDLVTARAPVAILAMPTIGRERQIQMLEGPLSYYRTVLVIPDLFEAPSLWVKPRDLSGILGLEITCNLMSPVARFTKRATDLALVLFTALFWVPFCGLLSALIWLEDRHDPLFRQERVGRDGRPFQTLKFRTMVPNAEAVLLKRLEEDEALRLEWTTTYKLKDDPRVTRIGRFLRRYSLDELPQLLNVLRDEMSLVGPRPLPFYHHNDLSPRAADLRERVHPGMTGLWQVSGRSDSGGLEGMEQWDPYYVRNWSLWLDVVILIRTVRAVFKGAGAY